jgi:hypothetical protein
MLVKGEAGRAAFHDWHAAVADARLALGHDKSLKQMLAFLYVALRANDVDLDPSLATYLRTAYVQERLRGKAYQDICAEVLRLLVQAAVPVLVIGGAALAQSGYEDPLLRHASTFDLLLAAEDLDRAAATLEAAGCARELGHTPWHLPRIRLRHGSALPIVLHAALFTLPYYADPLRDVWQASRHATVAGVATRMLSIEDTLLLLCAMGSPLHVRTPPWWVCDAMRLLTLHPDLEWDTFLARARSTRLSLPLLVSLTYLQRDLGASIPPGVLAELTHSAVRLPASSYEAALWALQRALPLSRRELLRRTGGWHSRWIVLKWLLAPSVAALPLLPHGQRAATGSSYYLYQGADWMRRHLHPRS